MRVSVPDVHHVGLPLTVISSSSMSSADGTAAEFAAPAATVAPACGGATSLQSMRVHNWRQFGIVG